MPSPSSLLKLPNTVLPQTPTIADRKVSGFVGRTVYTAKHCVLKSNRTQNIPLPNHMYFETDFKVFKMYFQYLNTIFLYFNPI